MKFKSLVEMMGAMRDGPRMVRRLVLPLLVVALAMMAGCVEELGPDDNWNTVDQALSQEITSDVPAQADGPNIATKVFNIQGDFGMEKVESILYDSTGDNPFASFEIRGEDGAPVRCQSSIYTDRCVLETGYQAGDDVILAPVRLTELGLHDGTYQVRGSAIPDMGFEVGGQWLMLTTSRGDMVGTTSPWLMVTIASTEPYTPEETDLSSAFKSNCGEGNDNGNGKMQCTGWLQVLGDVVFKFPCEDYVKVTLTTNRSVNDKKHLDLVTTLEVSDAGANSHTPDQNSHGATDVVSMSPVEEPGICTAVVKVADAARIKLKISQKMHAEMTEEKTDLRPIYFALFYVNDDTDADQSFRRAARTYYSQVTASPKFKKGARFEAFAFTTEEDFKRVWDALYALGESGAPIVEGRLFSHSYKDNSPDEGGLSFAIGEDGGEAFSRAKRSRAFQPSTGCVRRVISSCTGAIPVWKAIVVGRRPLRLPKAST